MENKESFFQEVTVVQLSEKDKQALQEKYREQRQKMWSGKQSTSQDSEEQTVEVDQPDVVEDIIDTTSTNLQSDSVSMEADPPTSAKTTNQEINQDESNPQTESETEGTPIAEDAKEQGEPPRGEERIFWETEREGGPSPVTWKLVIAIIGAAIVLIGVGVYLGFLFAG